MKIVINGQMLHQSNTFVGVLTPQILNVLSVVPNIYQKFNYIRFSKVYFFFEYDHLI